MNLRNGASTRKVAAKFIKKYGFGSKTTIMRVIKEDLGLIPFRKYKQQKLSPTHMANRVICAEKFLHMYGVYPNSKKFRYKNFCNTDFSAYMRCIRPHNIKNDIIWATTRSEVDINGLGGASTEKYSAGVMIWGGITGDGLFPTNSPIFFSDWLKKECKRKKKKKITMDGAIYFTFLKNVVFPQMEIDLGYDCFEKYLWQDDPDTKHRMTHVMNLIEEKFDERVNAAAQSSKMSDVWPIENVWGMVREGLGSKEFRNVKKLKKAIVKEWTKITPDQCARMMTSIPRRLKAVMKCNGQQINKGMY